MNLGQQAALGGQIAPILWPLAGQAALMAGLFVVSVLVFRRQEP